MPETKVCSVCDASGTMPNLKEEVRMQDLLNDMYAYGRRLETWGRYKEFKNYETIFFDVVAETDKTTGETLVSYKFKDGLASAYDVLTNDDCEVEWMESKICGNETVVVEDAEAGQKNIKVKSLKPLNGIGINSTILVTIMDEESEKYWLPINGLYIESIDSANNTIILQDNLAETIKAGAIVRRWAYLRDRGCGLQIRNTVELDGMDKYASKFRTISIHHEIEACDLNKPYLVSGGAQAILDARLKKGDYEAIKEFIHAVFYDRNIDVTGRNPVTGTKAKASETYGLFPALKEAQDRVGLKVAFDLSKCCDPEASDCVNARAQIAAFLDIVINKTEESGMFDDTITVAMNGLARKALFKMQGYFQDYGNVGFMSGEQWDILVREPRINYAGKVIDFKYLPILDDYRIPVMLTMPLDKVGVYQKKYKIVNPDTLKVEGLKINGTLANGTPALRYIPEDPHTVAARLGECNVIVWDMEFAVIWMWVDKGAYRMILNFGSCVVDKCNACTIADAAILA